MLPDSMCEPVDHVDVMIIGAGISGIGAGCHLQMTCPDRTFTILESRKDLGGTWDLFRYPGVRSDSDMHTLSYRFKPWSGSKSIADGRSILAYLRDTAAYYGIDNKIRFQHQVASTSWSSEKNSWTIIATRTDTNESVTFTSTLLLICAGYYSYEGGHEPIFPGVDSFEGQVIHPQAWPEGVDYKDKKIIVIGSGATAVTLVPAMAEHAAHVTMLQRSPTYVVAMPEIDKIADRLRRILPATIASRLVRWKNIKISEYIYKRTRTKPDKVRRMILKQARKSLGSDVDVDRHFNPTYDPWDQRLCLIPNGDLFEVLKSGKASVVTDRIKTFTPTGIQLESGDHHEADIVVTATGLRILTLGGINIAVDGEPVDLSKRWTYKGVAYSDVPNLISMFGYINASWTLRVDLICDYVCRLLNHMRSTGATCCTPRLRASDHNMPKRPLISDFSSGYIQRALPRLPSQGDREPWTNLQSYSLDKKALTNCPVNDGVMTFTHP